MRIIMGAAQSYPIRPGDMVLEIQMGSKDAPTHIIDSKTRVVLYTLMVQTTGGVFTKRKTLHFYRGNVVNAQTAQPFASIAGKNVEVAFTPGSAPAKVKTAKFLYTKGWSSEHSRFEVAGREYKLKKSFNSVLILPAGAKVDAADPILVFTRRIKKTKMISPNTIHIPAGVLSHQLRDPYYSHAALKDGKATLLLDHAIVAEMMYQRNQAKSSRGAEGIELLVDVGSAFADGSASAGDGGSSGDGGGGSSG